MNKLIVYSYNGILHGKRKEQMTSTLMGFPRGSVNKESSHKKKKKESTHNSGDLGSIPGLGRSPGEGNSYLLQCSGLENSMDCIVHRVAKSRIRLSDFHLPA